MDYDFTYTGAEIQEILDTAKKLKDSGYIFLGVATPSTNPGTPTQKVYYEAKQAGTYTNFGGVVLPDGMSLLIWNGSWTSETVMSGDGGVFDISVYKSTGGTLATFADLSAALDGGNNIPASARKGGMSVKFVQSSDHKYIQARLMANSFSTDVTQWQVVDDEPVAGSKNLVESGGTSQAMNTIKAVGDGDIMINAIHSNIIQGHKYRVYVNNVNPPLDGVTRGSNLIRFALAIVDSNNNVIYKYFVATDNSNSLSSFYDIDTTDAVAIKIIMRAAAGFVQYFSIKDKTITDELYNSIYNDQLTRFNIWDEQVENGKRLISDGTVTEANAFVSRNYIPVLPNTQYNVRIPTSVYTGMIRFVQYDYNHNFLDIWLVSPTAEGSTISEEGVLLFTTSPLCAYLKFSINDNTYNNDICINISRGYEDMTPKDGDYIPFNSPENYKPFKDGSENMVEGGGVKVREIRFKTKRYYGAIDGIYRYLSHNTRCASDIIEIPKSGIYIYSANDDVFRVRFVKKNSDGNYIAATDYVDYSLNDRDLHVVFLHYQEGVSFVISQLNESVGTKVYASYGCVSQSGGRLPNLRNLIVYAQYIDNTVHLCLANGFSVLNTYGSFYGSVLRLQDVDSIFAAPPFSLVARIYRIDNDNKQIVYVEDILCTALHAESTALSGVGMIDFTKYDFDGYAVIGIITGIDRYTSNGYAIPSYTGMMNRFTDTQKNVFVKWKADKMVTYESSIPSVVSNNIQIITNNVFAPNLQASPSADVGGGYSSWITDRLQPWNAMGKCKGCWYGGGNEYNVPHMHVNPKSYITASKNKYSRIYISKGQHDVNLYGNLYGSVCSATLGTVLGIPCGIETMEIVSRLHENFDYREYTSFEDVQPGDVFGQLDGVVVDGRTVLKSGDYGHVIYIAEKITINGEVFCINSFEGYLPWIGWDTYVNHSAHINYTVVNPEWNTYFNILSWGSSRWFGSDGDDKLDGRVGDKPFKVLARPNYKVYQTMRNAYNKYDIQDYPVTEIMCDRGTDAVYCIGEYLGLTVTDGTTSIELYKDGVPYSTIDLTTCTIKPTDAADNVTVYDICDKISESGYYEIYVSGEKKESFFVPPTRFVYDEIDGDEVVIYFDPNEEDDTVIAFDTRYINNVYDGTYRKRRHFFNDIDGSTTYEKTFIIDGIEIVKTVCEYRIPKVTTYCDGVQREIVTDDLRILRKTSYGTYWVKDTAPCLQRAGRETL